jgi:hypothetical protein
VSGPRCWTHPTVKPAARSDPAGRSAGLLQSGKCGAGERGHFPEGLTGSGINDLTVGPLRLMGRLSPAAQGLPLMARASLLLVRIAGKSPAFAMLIWRLEDARVGCARENSQRFGSDSCQTPVSHRHVARPIEWRESSRSGAMVPVTSDFIAACVPRSPASRLFGGNDCISLLVVVVAAIHSSSVDCPLW